MRNSVTGCTEQRDERRPKHEHDDADHYAEGQQHIKAEGTDAAHFFLPAFAHQDREQGTAALREDIAECHEKREDRRAERDAGNDVRVTGLCDEEGVGQVVDQGHHHAENKRDGEFEVCFGVFFS